MNRTPNELELYYNASYVGKWGAFEIFRRGDKFYAMLEGRAAEIDNFDLGIIFN